jgi:Ca-activated chloride channel homolog
MVSRFPGLWTRRACQWMAAFPLTLALVLAQDPAAPSQPQPTGTETAAASQLAPAQPPFRVQANEVIVPVTVTDPQTGAFVTGLKQEDFTILDEGKPQTITHFSAEHSQPVVIGFLIDLSNASRIQWQHWQDAAVELVYTLLPGGDKYAGYLIGFGSEAELMVDTTTDADKIVDRLRKISPGGGSAFYDAIYMACKNRKEVKGEPFEPRRVIVVIGDGHDNASSHTLDQVVELAQRNSVTVYAISTENYGFISDSRKNLNRLAEETGGRVEQPLLDVYNNVSGFLSQSREGLNYQLPLGTGAYTQQIVGTIEKTVADISGEITLQYVLHYVPNLDDSLVQHNIVVKVNLVGGLTVRARENYYPHPPP